MRFRSLRSGSSGNCLQLRGEASSILIDCGLRTKKAAERLLLEEAGGPWAIRGAVFSHCHGDHVGRYPVQALREMGIPLFAHEECLAEVRRALPGDPPIRTFGGRPFRVGEFELEAVRLKHYPRVTTFGFVARCGGRKAAILTDFFAWEDRLIDVVKDSHFIYLEANYDSELLRKRYNPGSEYHMRNEAAAELLCDIVEASAAPPKAVMLGHLSKDRNTSELAVGAFRSVCSRRGVSAAFELHVAPRDNPSAHIDV